ncbi:YajQ family cyclic di-GMP-binding protein [soil metagenome]
MPSFDIVNEIDHQKLDNAINVAVKEFSNRFDFHGSKTTLELDKKTLVLTLVTENEMRVKSVQDILISRMMKQGMDSSALDFGKEHYASGNMVRKEIKIKQGIDKESAKKVVKVIKESGQKVQASIMDEQIRVTGKKLDDLQAVIATVKTENWDFPIQFTNFRN